MVTFKGFRASKYWKIRAQNGKKSLNFGVFEWCAKMATFKNGQKYAQMATFKSFRASKFWTIRAQNDEKTVFWRFLSGMATLESSVPK